MVEVYWIVGKYCCWEIFLLFCLLFALSIPYNSWITLQQWSHYGGNLFEEEIEFLLLFCPHSREEHMYDHVTPHFVLWSGETHVCIVLSSPCAKWIIHTWKTFESGWHNYVPRNLTWEWSCVFDILSWAHCPENDSFPHVQHLSMPIWCGCFLSCPVYRNLSNYFCFWEWFERE
jgi:hypothetical protein